MPRAAGSAEHLAELGLEHNDGPVCRVHLVCGQGEDGVHSSAGALGSVRLQFGWVLGKVLLGPELERFHKDADDDLAGLPASARASRMRCRCPSWSAPMVGTKTTGP